MSIPGWSPAGGSWTTHLAGWPQPVAPPDYEAINATRLARSITITLNDFTATNVTVAGTREQISLETLEGWWEPAGDATETTRHPIGDGDISFRLRQTSRVITVSGLIKTDPTAADAERLLTLMDDVNAQTRSGVLLVQEHMRGSSGMNREVDVRRQSLQMTPLGHAYAAFTLVLVADDPLRYGTSSQHLPRNVETIVSNSGDARVYPIIEFNGTASNPGVDYGSLTWRLGQSTRAGDHYEVHCVTGDVFRNGSRIFPTWSGYWPYLNAGVRWGFTPVGVAMTFRRKAAWN